MSDVLATFEQIHAQLCAGSPADVQAVLMADTGWQVRWGVDGLWLGLKADGARELADAFEAAGYMPSLRRLLRLAADVCDQKSAVAT